MIFTYLMILFTILIIAKEIISLTKHKKSIINNFSLSSLRAICAFYAIMFDIVIFYYMTVVFFNHMSTCIYIILICLVLNIVTYLILKKLKDKINGYAFLSVFLIISAVPFCIFTYAYNNLDLYEFELYENNDNSTDYNFTPIESVTIKLNMFGQCNYHYKNTQKNTEIVSKECSFNKDNDKITFTLTDKKFNKDYKFSCTVVGKVMSCPAHEVNGEKNINLELLP